jgi:hypothetical protein
MDDSQPASTTMTAAATRPRRVSTSSFIDGDATKAK